MDHRRNARLHRDVCLRMSYPTLIIILFTTLLIKTKSLFEPNVGADGTVVFTAPVGHIKSPLTDEGSPVLGPPYIRRSRRNLRARFHRRLSRRHLG
jgi:hypothetical protein